MNNTFKLTSNNPQVRQQQPKPINQNQAKPIQVRQPQIQNPNPNFVSLKRSNPNLNSDKIESNLRPKKLHVSTIESLPPREDSHQEEAEYDNPQEMVEQNEAVQPQEEINDQVDEGQQVDHSNEEAKNVSNENSRNIQSIEDTYLSLHHSTETELNNKASVFDNFVQISQFPDETYQLSNGFPIIPSRCCLKIWKGGQGNNEWVVVNIGHLFNAYTQYDNVRNSTFEVAVYSYKLFNDGFKVNWKRIVGQEVDADLDFFYALLLYLREGKNENGDYMHPELFENKKKFENTFGNQNSVRNFGNQQSNFNNQRTFQNQQFSGQRTNQPMANNRSNNIGNRPVINTSFRK